MTFEIHFESQILSLFDKAAKLGKASGDAYNGGGWLILEDLLNELVTEGVSSHPHDFRVDEGGRKLPRNWKFLWIF